MATAHVSNESDFSQEEWRPVEGYEGIYAVSNLGRVRSFGRRVKNGRGMRNIDGRILRYAIGSHGYASVGLYVDAVHDRRLVHRMVAEAFIGIIGPGMEVCHNDGDKLNNRADNLRIDTPAGNTADKYTHGTVRFGEESSTAKLTEDEVVEIRELHFAGVSRKDIAAKFGLNADYVGTIARGLRWTHVSGPLAEKRPMRGENHWGAKLTDAQVEMIRSEWRRGGRTQYDIAKEFCVSRRLIGNIVNGRHRACSASSQSRL